MLPVYASYYLKAEGGVGYGRGLVAGASTSLGYVGVFLILGLAVYRFGEVLTPHIPKLEVVVGVILVLLGALTLSGKKPSTVVSYPLPESPGISGFFAFGVLYAVAAVSCVLPVFVGIVTYAMTLGDLGSVATVFLVYGASMGGLMMTMTLAMAGGKEVYFDYLRRYTGRIEQLSAIVMLGVGFYLIYLYHATL